MQIWSINYFKNVKIHKDFVYKIHKHVYFGRYLVLTYIERFISAVCCFFSYICWSVNYMSWVSKFNIFFWHVRKLRQDLYLSALILSFIESSFLTPWYFFCFLYLVCKLFKGLFQSLCQSVNSMSLWFM